MDTSISDCVKSYNSSPNPPPRITHILQSTASAIMQAGDIIVQVCI